MDFEEISCFSFLTPFFLSFSFFAPPFALRRRGRASNNPAIAWKNQSGGRMGHEEIFSSTLPFLFMLWDLTEFFSCKLVLCDIIQLLFLRKKTEWENNLKIFLTLYIHAFVIQLNIFPPCLCLLLVNTTLKIHYPINGHFMKNLFSFICDYRVMIWIVRWTAFLFVNGFLRTQSFKTTLGHLLIITSAYFYKFSKI